MATSNVQLIELGKFYKLNLYPPICKNELEGMVPMDMSYIINLQDSDDGGGTHWVSLKVLGNQACYFDSFGCVPPPIVSAFVKRRRGCKMVYNRFIIQDLKSERCGLFALACLLYLATHKNDDLFFNYNNFINGFDENTLINDMVLKSFYRQYFGEKIPPLIKKFIESK